MTGLRTVLVAMVCGCVEQPAPVVAESPPAPVEMPVPYVPPSDWPADCPSAGSIEAEPGYRQVCEQRSRERERLRIAAEQGVPANQIDWLAVARQRCFPKRCPPEPVGGYCVTERQVPITDIPDRVVVQALTEKCLEADRAGQP